jgi:hypothetical protein
MEQIVVDAGRISERLINLGNGNVNSCVAPQSTRNASEHLGFEITLIHKSSTSTAWERLAKTLYAECGM